MKLQKVIISVFLSFRRKRTNVVRWPESSKFNLFWMPDQVRHDDSWTFFESIKFYPDFFRTSWLVFVIAFWDFEFVSDFVLGILDFM